MSMWVTYPNCVVWCLCSCPWISDQDNYLHFIVICPDSALIGFESLTIQQTTVTHVLEARMTRCSLFIILSLDLLVPVKLISL